MDDHLLMTPPTGRRADTGGLVLGDDPPALVGELVHPAGTSCLLSIALLPRSASHPQITSQWPEQHATNHRGEGKPARGPQLGDSEVGHAVLG